MDKSCQASVESTSTSSSATGRDHNSLNLSKLSHKISKATSQLRKPCFDAPLNQNHPSFNHPQNPQNRFQSAPPPVQTQQQQNLQAAQQQHQPPVYNINKNDFRDVVQKLTGSPAHERFSNPPPIQPPKPQSSRLQRIRPPPLAHVTNRPPPSLNTNMPPPQQQLNNVNLNNFHPSTAVNFGLAGRPMAPLSPLPPLPTVHAAAESPVSAYMRYIQNSIPTADSNPLPPQGFSPLGPMVSSCWNNFTAQQQGNDASPAIVGNVTVTSAVPGAAVIATGVWMLELAKVLARCVLFPESDVFAIDRSIRVSTVAALAYCARVKP